MTSEAPVWQVEMPDRRQASFGGSKPRATLVVGSDTDYEERMSIPRQVGRILASKQKSGEVRPQSRAELMYVLGELSRSCASARIERLIDRREYAENELREKLRQDGYATKTIDACIERASAAGLVSNSRYADSFIRSKVYAGWGMSRIERELSQKGIDVSEVEGWPYEYLDPDDELSRALELVAHKRFSGSRPFEKIVRFLCGRGFTLGVATRAARQMLEDADEEWD